MLSPSIKFLGIRRIAGRDTVILVTIGAIYMVHKKAEWYGIGGVGAFTLLALIVHFMRKPEVEGSQK